MPVPEREKSGGVGWRGSKEGGGDEVSGGREEVTSHEKLLQSPGKGGEGHGGSLKK